MAAVRNLILNNAWRFYRNAGYERWNLTSGGTVVIGRVFNDPMNGKWAAQTIDTWGQIIERLGPFDTVEEAKAVLFVAARMGT